MYQFLLLDDEPLIRQGTLKKISRLELDISCNGEAADGLEGLSILENNHIDFIITDMDMPNMNGVEFLDILIERYPKKPIIVISGYQNFNYVKKALEANAINYILKPFTKEDLGESIENVIQTLNNLEENKSRDKEFILNKILGISSQGSLALLKKNIDNSKAYKLILLYGENPSLKKDLSFQHPDNKNLWIAIVSENDYSSFITLNEVTLIGVSSLISDFDRINDYFLEAVNQLNSQKKVTSTQLFAEVTNSDNKNTIFLYTKEILYFIESGQKEQVQEKLPNYLNQSISTHNLSLGELKRLIFQLIKETKILLDDYYQTESNYTIPQLTEKIWETMFDFDEVISFSTDFLATIAESMSYENIYDSHDLISNVQSYLDKHFSNNISLDFLSDIFYINSSYLSTLFKEKTGQKYIDYLNKIRISAAKELLITTDKKTKNIAHAVGYDNEKYFFRIFKKHTNMTPEEFKKEHKIEN